MGKKIPTKYYIDWTGLEDFKSYNFDDLGLPRVHYGKKVGLVYNPITIAQYGLYRLAIWSESQDNIDKHFAFVCGDWLVKNAKPWEHSAKAWIYQFDLEFYGKKAPWISAMAQGEAISLLIRLNEIHESKSYSETIHSAIIPFKNSVANGGVLEYLEDGAVVFQEYPSSPAAHVLNGHVFSLLGVLDYSLYFENESMKTLALDGLNTVAQHWQKWDCGFWTRYDLYGIKRLASPMYHELHIRQMQALVEIFDSPELKKVVKRWQQMQRNPLDRTKWLIGKLMEKGELRRYAR